jgi:DHA1 family bicyclomycin/chloramphenicol resistance-like MFS transporter
MGDLAGTATSIIGFLSLAGGALLGASIDRQITSTVTPLSAGYVLFTGIGLVVLAFVVPKVPQKLQT